MTKQELFGKLPKNINTKSNVLILTHTDADGAMAAIVLSLIFEHVTIEHCSNGIMSRKIKEAVTNDEITKNYDYIFVCDISCTEKDAEIINENKNRDKVILIDHHGSAGYLNKYKWACVETDILSDSFCVNYYEELGKTGHSSAASLVFDYMEHINLTKNIKNIKLLMNMVHLVAAYDTWDWVNVFYESAIYDRFRLLCDLYGIDLFEDVIIERLTGQPENASLFSDMDRMLLRIEEGKIERYIEQTKKCFISATMSLYNENNEMVHYRIMYSFSDRYLQETFKAMKECDPDVDFYILNYGTGISVRSTKDEIDVGKFLKNYGGGGHPGAGGFKIPFETQRKYLEEAMNAIITPDERE